MNLENFTTCRGLTTIKVLLKDKYSWDGMSPRVLVSHQLNQASIIESTNWVLVGSLKLIAFPASHIWKNAHPSIRVTMEMKDLSVFEFLPTSNISRWLDSSAVQTTFSIKSGKDKLPIGIEEAKEK